MQSRCKNNFFGNPRDREREREMPNGNPRPTQKIFCSHYSHHILCFHISTDAFVEAMARYGFEGLSAFDIVNTGKQVREEIAKTDPERAAAL